MIIYWNRLWISANLAKIKAFDTCLFCSMQSGLVKFLPVNDRPWYSICHRLYIYKVLFCFFYTRSCPSIINICSNHMRITDNFVIGKIDDLHISHNASDMEANIRVLLISNSINHSSLDVNGLELPCLSATLCFTRLRSQGSSLMRSWC